MDKVVALIEQKMYKLPDSNQYVMNVEDVQQALELLYAEEIEKTLSKVEQMVLSIQTEALNVLDEQTLLEEE
jgi:hypothetical protein